MPTSWLSHKSHLESAIFGEKSGPPAWKQLPTWYQISESDLMIPPVAQHDFAKKMNATQFQSMLVMHHMFHTRIIFAKLIIDAVKGSTK